MDEHGPTAASSVCDEVAEMAQAARRRGEPVRLGAATPSGWRVLARATLSDTAGGRQDLWAVQAPTGAGGGVRLLTTGAGSPLFRFYALPCPRVKADRLLAECRSRVAGVEALLAVADRAAAAAASRPGSGEGGTCHADGERPGAAGPRAPGLEPPR